jgi:peptidoglycan hydrolase-like protein with peptidoglycan-binding domain
MALVALGDFFPGQSSTEVELAQRGLKSIGFDVPINGAYDAATGAAVLEFRGAAGLPYVNQIDDQFLDRLWVEVDAAGNTDNLPPGLHPGDVTQGEISITGKVGAGLGLLALLAIAYGAKKSRKKK